MLIGGLQKFSLIDYPKKVAAVIFTQGCNFRCPFCQNPDLVLSEKYTEPISEEEIFSFLRTRQGQLSGVVVTGGEPTVHADLPDFLKKIKDLGYAVKLDTNGNDPETLKKVLDEKSVDYVAMDIKTSPARYDEAAGVAVDMKNIERSIELIIDSGVDYHFRTTLVYKYLSEKDLEDISGLLKKAKNYVLQRFDPKPRLLDESLKDARVYSEEQFNAFKTRWQKPVFS